MKRSKWGLATTTAMLFAAITMLGAETAGAAEAAPQPLSAKSSKSMNAVIAASNRFGAALVGRLVKQSASRNAVLSPYGVSAALSMLALGAEGDTRTILRNSLGYAHLTPEQVVKAYTNLHRELATALNEKILLKTANGIWLPLDAFPHPHFKDSLAGAFSATLRNLDFASGGAAEEIDGWVSTATGGRIAKMIDGLDSRVAFVLANAVYFKGAWAKAFDLALTKPASFTRADGRAVDVPMMSATMTVDYAVVGDHHAVSLPYHDGRFRLIVLTSRDLRKGPIHRLVTSRNLADVFRGLAFKPSEINLRLPRFRIEVSEDLTKILTAGGLSQAFTPSANYRRITPAAIDELQVLHRVSVELNEAGTEASAAIAIIGMRTLEAEPPTFSADRPFAIAILERVTGALVFLGYVGDPTLT